MTTRGILLDFYGTVVDEDDDAIADVMARISLDNPGSDVADVPSRWWAGYSAATERSFGAAFRTQREIATESLARALAETGLRGDAAELCATQFDYWRQPRLRRGSLEFVAGRSVPICIVSNIDREDLEAALAHVGIVVDGVVTSDDAGAYKPRAEMFRRGLDLLALEPAEALHVGDSLRADIGGATELGIPAAWIRRGRPPRRDGPAPAFEADDLGDLGRQLVGR